AGVHHRRRAHLGAGYVHPGPGAQSAAAPAAAAGHHLPVHRARPFGDAVHLGPDRRHPQGGHRRAGRRRGVDGPPHPSLHPQFAVGHPHAQPPPGAGQKAAGVRPGHPPLRRRPARLAGAAAPALGAVQRGRGRRMAPGRRRYHRLNQGQDAVLRALPFCFAKRHTACKIQDKPTLRSLFRQKFLLYWLLRCGRGRALFVLTFPPLRLYNGMYAGTKTDCPRWIDFKRERNTMPVTNEPLYASQAQPWMAFYYPKYRNMPVPDYTAFEYDCRQNKGHLADIALNYYGVNISYATLIV